MMPRRLFSSVALAAAGGWFATALAVMLYLVVVLKEPFGSTLTAVSALANSLALAGVGPAAAVGAVAGLTRPSRTSWPMVLFLATMAGVAVGVFLTFHSPHVNYVFAGVAMALSYAAVATTLLAIFNRTEERAS